MAAAREQTIVVAEDDASIADLLDLYLRDAGFRPLLASSGERALQLVNQHRPVLVVIDVGLPGMDGFELCERIRETKALPVVFVTARDAETDRVHGLELGGDDYVVKPFSPRELVARVRAILRRGAAPPSGGQAVVEVGASLDVDTTRREVRLRGQPVALATREFDLLAHLARNQGVALTRRQLLDAVWGDDWDGDERTVDVHIAQLRKKLGDDLPLVTVWGVGYRLG
ncbi:MAG TPA: response regulator transcription factor [Acidimicrobiales bacterium]|nr:response regulator transcription factor [Acidimicrobiales bacterium]